MDEDRAYSLGNLAADFYLNHPDFSEAVSNRVNSALSFHARDALPSDAVAAVVEHPERLPLILAATDSRLYLLDVAGGAGQEDGEIETRCRSFPLDPATVTIEQRAHYRRAEGGGHSLRHAWTLRVAGFEVTIHSRVWPDGRADDHEGLARRIAQGLGWQFPE
jgi:hypothetical protein